MAKIVHKLIAKIAKQIAAEVYEVCASNDAFYRQYRSQRRFVQQQWHQFIGDARKSLLAMLKEAPDSTPQHPTYVYSQHVRDEVFEALIAEGGMKAPAPLDLARLRANAGFDPLTERGNALLH